MSAARRLSILVVAVVLGLTACGDDGGGNASGSGSGSEPEETTTTEEPEETTTTTEDVEGDLEPYVESVLANFEGDAPPGLDSNVTECMAEAVVAAGGEQLLEEDIDPDEFGAADSYDDVGIELDDDQIDQLSDDLQDCGAGSFFAFAFVQGAQGDPESDASICLADALSASPTVSRTLAELFAGVVGDEDAAFGDILNEGVVACPDVLVDILTTAFEQQGVAVSEDLRSCMRDQIVGREVEVAEALIAQGAEAEAFGQEIASACGEFIAG